MVGKESMTDMAYEILKGQKKAMLFYDLWEKVIEKLAISPELEETLISHFYTNVTIDGRFVNVGDNKWDLRERVPYEKVHIDMNEIYQEEDELEEFYDLEDDEDDENIVEGLYISEEEDEEKPQKFEEFASLIPDSEEEE